MTITSEKILQTIKVYFEKNGFTVSKPEIQHLLGVLRNKHSARLTLMFHITGNLPTDWCYKLVDCFLFE